MPDLHLRSGIAIIPPPRPAFVGGKGSPCEKKKGAFVRKRSKASFDPKEFLTKVGEGKTISKYRKDQIVGKNDIQISEGSNCFLARTGRGRGFLHPARQDQTHRYF